MGNKNINLLSLFSGIGAFEKALERKGIGYNLVNYCEFDKFASKSYSLIHGVPETMNLGDITKVKINELKPHSADLITYGFPCQDISVAGKQRGFEHDGKLTRSGLFFYAAAIIGRIQPKVAICENVKALVGKKFTKEFETVLQTLEDMGYTNYWQVLNAKDYGIPQNRERVFIVSIRNDIDTGDFEFQKGFPLKLKLKDMLESEVDEKYYLSNKMFNYVFNIEKEHKGIGFSDGVNKSFINPDISNTLSCRALFGQRSGTATYVSDVIDYKLQVSDMKKIFAKEATKKGYAEAEEGDSINLEQPNSKTRRGRVGKQVAQTLTTSPQQAVVEPFIVASSGGNQENPSDRTNRTKKVQRLELKFDGTTNTITSVSKDNYAVNTDLRIRKLTPKEAFRLMGFDDKDVDVLVENGISNTQLYKQAGNSIVVNVLEKILENLIDVL